MTDSRRLSLRLLACAVAVLATALVVASSQAIVPPKNCKTIRVKGKTYRIKSDQLSCKTARRYATNYLSHRTKPRGYKCYRYSGSSLVAKCVNTKANPDRTIFMIKKK